MKLLNPLTTFPRFLKSELNISRSWRPTYKTTSVVVVVAVVVIVVVVVVVVAGKATFVRESWKQFYFAAKNVLQHFSFYKSKLSFRKKVEFKFTKHNKNEQHWTLQKSQGKWERVRRGEKKPLGQHFFQMQLQKWSNWYNNERHGKMTSCCCVL